MQILSYRGPSQPGGVATLLHSIGHKNNSWWYLDKNRLQGTSMSGERFCSTIREEIVEGHYRFCNEFLWPLMHDRGDLARYNEPDHQAYRLFNIIIGSHINWNRTDNQVFLHDYQLAFVPRTLRESASTIGLFWHIPFPQEFPEFAYPAVFELIESLLRCDILAFHIKEYVLNFTNLVVRMFPKTSVAPDLSFIIVGNKRIRLVTAPASIETSFWQKAATKSAPQPTPTMKYILSVDRADYSKGVAERLAGIDMFFERNPHLREQLQFVMFCQRTRPGLAAYDEYWQSITDLYTQIDARHGNSSWRPIVWHQAPVSAESLAPWYRNASAMLITPTRDGLNLTAKEFAASANEKTGPLILSKGAGAWHELSSGSITLNDTSPALIARAVEQALAQYPYKTRHSNQLLQRIVRRSSFSTWWTSLLQAFDEEREISALSSGVGAA